MSLNLLKSQGVMHAWVCLIILVVALVGVGIFMVVSRPDYEAIKSDIVSRVIRDIAPQYNNTEELRSKMPEINDKVNVIVTSRIKSIKYGYQLLWGVFGLISGVGLVFCIRGVRKAYRLEIPWNKLSAV